MIWAKGRTCKAKGGQKLPAPACDLDFVPNVARKADPLAGSGHGVRVALSAAFGFGGHNTMLLLGRWAP